MRRKQSISQQVINGSLPEGMPVVSYRSLGLPLGAPPASLTDHQREVWLELAEEMAGWLDHTHRSILTLLSVNVARFREVNHALEKRCIKFEKRGKPYAYGYMNDEQTRPHPLLNASHKLSASISKALNDVCATPSAQARCLEFIHGALKSELGLGKTKEESYLV